MIIKLISRRKLIPGELVSTPSGICGIVISPDEKKTIGDLYIVRKVDISKYWLIRIFQLTIIKSVFK